MLMEMRRLKNMEMRWLRPAQKDMSNFIRKHWEGKGGIGQLMPIAVPMILSSVFDTVMTFVDRVYLAYISKEAMAGCMSGGLTSWTCQVFFISMLAYSSAIVARYYGAGEKKECPNVIYQCMYLGFASLPCIFLLGWGASKYLAASGHSPAQIRTETLYFWYMLSFCWMSVFRCAFCSFYAGIGRTKLIMFANGAALCVNLVANYLLIYGKCGLPRLEVAGAAIGTIMGGMTMIGILAICFWKDSHSQEFYQRHARRFNPQTAKAILKFGFPNGMDSFLGTFTFNLVVTAFHSFGADAAAATTIVMSWDLVSFFPLMGMQSAITTIVSQCLGNGDKKASERAAYSGLKVTWFYSLLCIIAFLALAEWLVAPFTPDLPGLDYEEVKHLAALMLRLTTIYLMLDATYLTFGGALRGGGDTVWSMFIGFCFHTSMTMLVLVMVYLLKATLLCTWIWWVFASFPGATAIYLRFRTKHWQNFDITGRNKARELA